MQLNLAGAAALTLSLGAARLVPQAPMTPIPPKAAPTPLATPVPRAEPPDGAAPRTLVLPPLAPEAPQADSAPLPSALPSNARRPRRARLTGGRLKATAGVTAELLADQGARDGFQMMRVGDSKGPMLSFGPVRQPLPVDPLVIDLDGDGLRTKARRVLFDLDGDGKRDSVNDFDRGDGLLVFDTDGDGKAGTDGRELLGDAARIGGAKAKYADGFAALEALVAQAAEDGLLSPEVGVSGRLSREDLLALEDSWGLRVRVGGLKGRDRRLTDVGVVRLDFVVGAAARHEDYDGRGNALTAAAGAQVVLLDGTRRAYGELWLRPKTGQLAPLAR